MQSPIHFLEFWSRSPSEWRNYDFFVVTDIGSQFVPIVTCYVTGISLFLFFQSLRAKNVPERQIQLTVWRRSIGLFLIALLQNAICWWFPDDLLEVDILFYMSLAQIIVYYLWILPKMRPLMIIPYGVAVFLLWRWAVDAYRLSDSWGEKYGEESIEASWSFKKDGIFKGIIGFLEQALFRCHFPAVPYIFFSFLGAMVGELVYNPSGSQDEGKKKEEDRRRNGIMNLLGGTGLVGLVALVIRITYQAKYLKNKYTPWNHVVESHPPSFWIFVYGYGVANVMLWVCWKLYDSPTPRTKLGAMGSVMNFFGTWMLSAYFWQHVWCLVPLRIYSAWRYPKKKEAQWYVYKKKTVPWEIAAAAGWVWLVGFYLIFNWWLKLYGGKYTLEWILRIITGEGSLVSKKPETKSPEKETEKEKEKEKSPDSEKKEN
eukprot:TRINITY_DN2466_c0_g1_i2.p1 TRINITY_DN2466_c0_g1~~TRINITY_DN2466_c0_g1_i2.p1  ORF type:complete len:460 (-),score=108.27 TRINITY_DN2466_c0_g1_i2:77-1363(-)